MNLKKRAAAGLLAGVTLTLGLPAITTTVAAAAPGSIRNNAAASAVSADSAQEAAIAAALAQPVPGHNAIVPDKPRANWPLISAGEIWDIEVVGQRVFVAGGFSNLRNQTGNTAVVNQRYLAAFNLQTGLVDTTFRPTFNGGVSERRGLARRHQAVRRRHVQHRQRHCPSEGRQPEPHHGCADRRLRLHPEHQQPGDRARGVELDRLHRWPLHPRQRRAQDRSGRGQRDHRRGRHRVLQRHLPAASASTARSAVQALKLTHDETKLLVIHTGRKIAGQDRLSMAWINTATKQLLPWRSRLWDDNLGRVGGVNRIYAARHRA